MTAALLDVTPCQSPYGTADLWAGDSVLRGQSRYLAALPREPFANISHRRNGQLGSLNTPPLQLPAFSNLIGMVVSIGPHEQMVRAHAGRGIAVVEYQEASRDGAIVNFPGQGGSLIGSMPARAAQPAISQTASIASPDPAWAETGEVQWNRAVSINLGPESKERSTVVMHRDDLPVSRGAGPGLLTQVRGVPLPELYPITPSGDAA